MADSLEVFNEIRQVRARLEGIEHTQEVLVRAVGDAILKQIWEYMDSDDILARVYLLVDGKRTQKDIVEALKAEKVAGASQPSVSRRLDVLQRELALITVVRQTKAGKVYRHTASDRILGVARKLERRRMNSARSPNEGS